MRRIAGTGVNSAAAAGHVSGANALTDPFASQEGTIARDGQTVATAENEDSVTDSDMDDVIKQTTLNRKARNVMHRVNKNWNNRITAAVTKEVEQTENLPKSGGGKRR